MKVIKYRIKENSFRAWLAAKKLGSDSVAMVMGRTIYLHGVKKIEFKKDTRWMRHEQAHIRQFMENGKLLFIAKYLIETLRHGYHNNKYEVEARRAEEDEQDL